MLAWRCDDGTGPAQPEASKAADAGGTAWTPTTQPGQDKPAPAVVDPKARKANAWTLGLATGQPEGTIMRFGAETARRLNDGHRLRVMPLIASGATGKVTDLMYLKGVDVAAEVPGWVRYRIATEKLARMDASACRARPRRRPAAAGQQVR